MLTSSTIFHLRLLQPVKNSEKFRTRIPVYADYLRVNELLAKVESEVRQSFETKIIHLATKDAETLKHIVGTWSVTTARDVAWSNAELLWALKNIPFLYNRSVVALAATVGVTGRLLVTPVVPPPPDRV